MSTHALAPLVLGLCMLSAAAGYVVAGWMRGEAFSNGYEQGHRDALMFPSHGAAIQRGMQVEKYTGDYEAEGVLCCAFETPDGKPRYVVAHPQRRGWILHIYSPANIRPTAAAQLVEAAR